jgi:ABC-type amino acid transport substrate-binding protein
MKYLLLIFSLLSSMAWAQTPGGGASTAAVLFNYHQAPPFVSENGTGFSEDLSDYLIRRIDSEQLSMKTLPRKRLDAVMAAPDFNGAVLLVAPLWFGDAGMKTYFWTKPIFVEEDVIVSPASRDFEYQSPDSLKGKTVGIVRGYQYPMFDALVESRSMTRYDTPDEISGLQMVSNNRLDAIVIARSTLGFMANELKVNDKIHVSAVPVNSYDRRILVSKSNPQLKNALDAVIAAMPKDPAWKAILNRYSIGKVR